MEQNDQTQEIVRRMKEGGREERTNGRTAEAGGYGALSNQLWVAGGGAGRGENDKTEERGRRRKEGGREGRTDGRTAEARGYGALQNQL